MKKKEITDFEENLKSITLIQMRDPEFNTEMTRLYVLVGDFVTMVRRPPKTLPLLDREVRIKASGRIIAKRKEEIK